MAAGLGTRLRPLTYEVPKPMVPVANRPVMEHIVLLLRRHGFGEVIANLHWFPDTIRDHFGDGSALGIELTYSYEDELLGTAGGVRNVAEFFGDEPFLVMAADALTDIDLAALRAVHEANDGIATLAVKRVANVSEFGVVITGSDGRIQGFQEKPDRAEALSDLASCMIYVLEREIFDYFPERAGGRLRHGRVPGPARKRRPVPRPRDRLLLERRRLPARVPAGKSGRGRGRGGGRARRVSSWSPRVGRRPSSGGIRAWTAGCWPRDGCEIGAGVRLDGPLVLGEGCTIGAGARVKESVVLPGAEVPQGALVAGAVYGRKATYRLT